MKKLFVIEWASFAKGVKETSDKLFNKYQANRLLVSLYDTIKKYGKMKKREATKNEIKTKEQSKIYIDYLSDEYKLNF